MQVIGFVALASRRARSAPQLLGAYSFTLAVIMYLQLPITGGITNLGSATSPRTRARVREIAGEIFALQALWRWRSTRWSWSSARARADRGVRRPDADPGSAALHGHELRVDAPGPPGHAPDRGVTAGRPRCFRPGCAVRIVSGYEGIRRYAWLFVGGLVLKHVLTTISLLRYRRRPCFGVSARRLWRRLRASLAIGVAVVMVQVYYQIDFVMLGYLDTRGGRPVRRRLPHPTGRSWRSGRCGSRRCTRTRRRSPRSATTSSGATSAVSPG